jgi:hypothetical protein
VRIIVPFAPGAGTDIYARLVGQRLSERLGQPLSSKRVGPVGEQTAVPVAPRKSRRIISREKTAHRVPIISAAARNNVPAVYIASAFARDGGLLVVAFSPLKIS